MTRRGEKASASVVACLATVAVVLASGLLNLGSTAPLPQPTRNERPIPHSGTLDYATFLGGDDFEIGWALAVDAAGSAYSVGTTRGGDFPVTNGAFQTISGGSGDAFVAKLSPDGSRLEWATYLGGDGGDGGGDVLVDPAGDVYVAGGTNGGSSPLTDFPTTPGAYDETFNGRGDGFVAKLSADGSRLLWSTVLGGTDNDLVREIAVDAAGSVYMTGYTYSPDFPTTPGAFDRTCGTDGLCDQGGGMDRRDGFAAKISADGRTLLWSTFLGGEDRDEPWTIVLDASGFPVVAGMTDSTQFPATPGAFQPSLRGPSDGFVVRLSPDGRRVDWGTFLGGSGWDALVASADSTGGISIAGSTNSSDFPATSGAFQPAFGGDYDAIAGKLSPDGRTLLWATYLGGSGGDGSNSIWESRGTTYVSGFTDSLGFPVTSDASDPSYNGGANDAFLVALSPAGTRLSYGTFLGGSGEDGSDHMVLGPSGDPYQGGRTTSPDFPATMGAFDTTLNGSRDAYVVKHSITPASPNAPPALWWTGEANYVTDGLDPEFGTTFTTFSYRVDYADTDGDPPSRIEVILERPAGTTWGIFTLSRSSWRGPPGNYTIGATYTFNATLPAGTDWWYAFRASDGWDWATGPPTFRVDAPDVIVDEPPTAVALASPTVGHMGEAIRFDAMGSTDDLGIAAYDWEFGDGDNDPNPVVTHAYGSRGTFLARLTVWDTINQSDVDTIIIGIENRPPTADAGPDRDGPKHVPMTLDGTGSVDLDGDSLSYGWIQTAGPPVSLSDANTVTATFTPNTAGAYVFSLEVADGWGAISNDAVNVNVANTPPTADAGLDRIVSKRAAVTLDGTESSDPDGDALSYAWSQTIGPVIALEGADSSSPTFSPPRGGIYEFLLEVSDGDGGVAADSVRVSASNAPPAADAGPDRTARKGTTVILDGSLSWDADGDGLTHSWTLISGPFAALTGAETATASFVPMAAGEYSFRLSVDDGDGGTSQDVTTVVVWGLPPVAALRATPSRAEVGVPIAFDASGSWDPDGTIVNFAFAFGNVAAAEGESAVRTYAFRTAATYVVTVSVTDDDGNMSTADVTVEVTAPSPPPPVSVNWKPLVAAVFVSLLLAAGFRSSGRRPWKDEASVRARLKAFAFVSLPFVLAEALTGVLSLFTGMLSIPPLVGLGMAVDLAILGAGVVFSILWIRGRSSRTVGDARVHRGVGEH